MFKFGLILGSCAVFAMAGVLPFGQKEVEVKIPTSLYCAMNGEVLFFAQGLSLPEDTVKNKCAETEKAAKVLNESAIKDVNKTNSFAKILVGVLALIAIAMGLLLFKKKYKKEEKEEVLESDLFEDIDNTEIKDLKK